MPTAPTVWAMNAQQTPTALHSLEESAHRELAATLGHALIRVASAGIRGKDICSRSQVLLSEARTLLGLENVKAQAQIGRRRALESKTQEVSATVTKQNASQRPKDSSNNCAECFL